MENLIGKYLFCEWKHNEGFEHHWLRRITRQTETQYIADCQHVLLLSEKYKKLYDAGSDYFYELFNHCATRFRLSGNKIVEKCTNLSNTDGVRTTTLVEDFSVLKCKYKFEDLFETDVRNFLNPDSRMLEHMGFMNDSKLNISEKLIYSFSVRSSENQSDLFNDVYGETVKHLKDLFGLPVFKANEFLGSIDTTHEKSRFSESAIHYHINHHGGDKPILTRDEKSGNVTIAFWVFDDKVVFKFSSGIDTW